MKQTPEGHVLAPAILRLLAFMIDAAVIIVIDLALISTFGLVEIRDGRPANVESLVTLLVMSASYHIIFVAARSATIGKTAMSVYIAYPNGERVRPDTAILRYIVLLLETFFLVGALISLVLMFADPMRRTLHDRVAGTIVLAGQPGKPLTMADIERAENERR